LVKRFFKYGELPLVLLALLREESLNGYEIMSELDRLFGPKYAASPGSVYPALSALEAEGLIKGTNSDAPKEYEVTRTGRGALEARLDQLAEIEMRSGAHLGPTDPVEAELSRLTSIVRASRGKVSPKLLAKMLQQSREKIGKLTEK
jgi:DNA-binding PadR family transcriptional regulator